MTTTSNHNNNGNYNNSNSNYPHIYHNSRHRHYIPTTTAGSSFKGCCCCIFLLLTFLALLAVAVALVLVLVVKPKKPQFQLRQVGVSYLLITQPTSPLPSTAAAYLTMNISMVFMAENPNKVEIKYEPTWFSVMYRGVPLGTGSVPAFEQPAHSSRLIETRVEVLHVNVLQENAVELVRDAVVDDRVQLRVIGDVGARIRVMSFTSPKVQVAVDCVVVISPRKQSVTSTQCGVDGVNV